MSFNAEEYMLDHRGRYVARACIRPLGMARHETVMELAAKAEALQRQMRRTRREMADTVSAFAVLSAEEYGVRIGGEKGNITLMSYDGLYKVVRQQAERVVYDETLRAAKALIDECLDEWTATTGPELRTIVTEAFDTDKEGRLNHSRIQSLCRYGIDDPRWQRAVGIIGKSRQVVDTASYVRVYKRDENGKYQPVALDMAAL